MLGCGNERGKPRVGVTRDSSNGGIRAWPSLDAESLFNERGACSLDKLALDCTAVRVIAGCLVRIAESNGGPDAFEDLPSSVHV